MQAMGSLAQLLNEYIIDELHDYHYYMALAAKIADVKTRNMVEEFARDEYQHAQLLTAYYVRLTGTMPMVGAMQIEPIGDDLEKVFMDRVVPETSDMKKWKRLYLSTSDPWLRDIAFNNMVDESQHAIRLLYLAEEADIEPPAKQKRYG